MVLRKIENKSFIRSSEGAIASYSYEEVASGLGFISFYAMTTVNWNGATNEDTYILSEGIRTSNLKYVPTVSGFGNDQYVTFNAPAFKFPRNAGGICYLNYNLGFRGGTAGTRAGYMVFELFKVSGATETSLGSVNSHRLSSNGVANSYYGEKTSQITVTNTHFKIGDFLRIKATAKTGGEDHLVLGCDPENESATTALGSLVLTKTRFKIEIPFRIDV